MSATTSQRVKIGLWEMPDEQVRRLGAAGVVLLAVLGSLGMSPLWASSWIMWTHDPLRSIGMFFPWVSLLGVWGALQRTGWRLEGTFWGLPLIAIGFVLATITNAGQAITIGIDGYYPQIFHNGVPLFCYGIGAVLLFGGMKLLRATMLPLCLLLMIDPVPTAFSHHFDLPLQQVSANTARAFAHLIGLKPTGAELTMMFTPNFGMMIVPGCNGVRGASTLAYLALFTGYAKGMSKKALALFSLSALLFGYGLNLLRLCVLVVYYRLGLSFPSTQNYGAQIDYVIGCTLFLTATFCIGMTLHVYGRRNEQPAAPVSEDKQPGPELHLAARALAFAVLSLVFILNVKADASGWRRPTREQAEQALPASAGNFTLQRRWYEQTAGQVVLVNGDYAQPRTGILTFGMWIENDYHLGAWCRRIRGDTPVQTRSLSMHDLKGLPVQVVTSYYDDGVSRHFDAESSCTMAGCDLQLADDPGKGLVLTSPRLVSLMVKPLRRLPVMLRREWADDDTPPLVQEKEFDTQLEDFFAHMDLKSVQERLRSPHS
jgi:exosortase J